MARKYETHVAPKLAVIEGWARDGLTLDQIASNLGISKTTLIKYRDQHPELLTALKSGKDQADVQVENALFREATGYHYFEETVTNKGEVVRVQRYARPSVTAQIFWLKNRRPDKWRDKQEHKHEVTQSLADVLMEAWRTEGHGDDTS